MDEFKHQQHHMQTDFNSILALTAAVRAQQAEQNAIKYFEDKMGITPLKEEIESLKKELKKETEKNLELRDKLNEMYKKYEPEKFSRRREVIYSDDDEEPLKFSDWWWLLTVPVGFIILIILTMTLC